MEENELVTKSVHEFLFANSKRYEGITNIYDVTEETFQDTIKEIQNHSEILFKDHSRSIFFFFSIIQASKFRFKKMELILDILIHFQAEIKKNGTSDQELITICYNYSEGLNYLFDNQFFSIESIFVKSIENDEIFITFLPEIRKYDSEYSEFRESTFVEGSKRQEIIDYYNYVKNNPEEHIFYRRLNYHPSVLHKSIREDNVEEFQSLLSKNNYSINHRIKKSFYERLRMSLDKDLSLIQIASFYGSLNIFKFLWFQPGIEYDENLLNYAYAGANIEIIHLCEKECEICKAYLQPIFTHHLCLLDYFIDNYEDKIANDEINDIKDIMKDFEKNDSFVYEMLNFDCLSCSIFSSNFEVMKECLRKIVFIVRNYDNSNKVASNQHRLLNTPIFDFELFKFLYFNRKPQFNKLEISCYENVILKCVINNANDTLKFLFNELIENKEFCFTAFENSLRFNHDFAKFMLDFQSNEDKNDENSSFYFFKEKMDFDLYINAVMFYDEDILVKLIQLYGIDAIDFNNNQEFFVSTLLDELPKKMILRLFDRILPMFPMEICSNLAMLFENENQSEISEYILKKIN